MDVKHHIYLLTKKEHMNKTKEKRMKIKEEEEEEDQWKMEEERENDSEKVSGGEVLLSVLRCRLTY